MSAVDASSALAPGDLRGDARRHRREAAVEWVLKAAAAVSILTSLLIVASLIGKAIGFLAWLDPWSSLFSHRGWSPSASVFDVRTILVGTTIISGVAMVVATPLGVGAAIYLAEYANPRVRRLVKPILEILAGIPSVVLGFFALTFITPNLVRVFFPTANLFNMLAGGIGVGILVSPLMASITEDALRAVPRSLREAAFGLGARKRTTIVKVVLPAALSGMVAAFIITVSRAIGETMIVTIAAGGSGSAPFTADPLNASLTMTSAIANLATGSDAVLEPQAFESLYFVGLLLFLITLGLNVLGGRIVRKYRRSY